jgi:endonuclease/exonuclease/phosphatase family metal-dependent hydrolase
MKSLVRKSLWGVGILLCSIILLVSGMLVFLMLTEFKPPRHLTPEIQGNGSKFNPSQREFTFLTWNIGYAGLGSDMDFFYDGGKKVIPGQDQCDRYFMGIKKTVKTFDTVDFIFLQEVDVHAKRSWYTNEADGLSRILPAFSMVFATNYDCRYVPSPLREPMGRVVSGLVTFAEAVPDSVGVQYYDAFFSWPTRMVFLKRCFLMLRYGLGNGKSLIIINTHNSAFDSTGQLRQRELATLDSVMNAEYNQGNYVVAGGDWNSNPVGFKASTIITGDKVTKNEPPIGTGFLPGWLFAYDSLHPTNRYADMPYKHGATRTTIIDFFVVSPNIEVTSVSAIPAGFAYSDHEPVVMGVRLRTPD